MNNESLLDVLIARLNPQTQNDTTNDARNDRAKVNDDNFIIPSLFAQLNLELNCKLKPNRRLYREVPPNLPHVSKLVTQTAKNIQPKIDEVAQIKLNTSKEQLSASLCTSLKADVKTLKAKNDLLSTEQIAELNSKYNASLDAFRQVCLKNTNDGNDKGDMYFYLSTFIDMVICDHNFAFFAPKELFVTYPDILSIFSIDEIIAMRPHFEELGLFMDSNFMQNYCIKKAFLSAIEETNEKSFISNKNNIDIARC